jgi:hypothetical protein
MCAQPHKPQRKLLRGWAHRPVRLRQPPFQQHVGSLTQVLHSSGFGFVHMLSSSSLAFSLLLPPMLCTANVALSLGALAALTPGCIAQRLPACVDIVRSAALHSTQHCNKHRTKKKKKKKKF